MKKELNEKAYSLIGVDGNAYAVMGYVARAMKECGKSKLEIDAYYKDAMSSDYNNLLCVSMDVIEMLNTENGYRSGHQYTKPDPIDWEDQEPDMLDESLDFPAYDDVEVDVPEIEDDFYDSSSLEQINPSDEALYMSAEDLEASNLSIDEMKLALHGFMFSVILCNGGIEVVITRNDLYNFYNKFAKVLKEQTGVSIKELKPFIYTAEDMNVIVKQHFDKYGRKFFRH